MCLAFFVKQFTQAKTKGEREERIKNNRNEKIGGNQALFCLIFLFPLLLYPLFFLSFRLALIPTVFISSIFFLFPTCLPASPPHLKYMFWCVSYISTITKSIEQAKEKGRST